MTTFVERLPYVRPFLLWLSAAVSIALQVLIYWGALFDADVLCLGRGGGGFSLRAQPRPCEY